MPASSESIAPPMQKMPTNNPLMRPRALGCSRLAEALKGPMPLMS